MRLSRSFEFAELRALPQRVVDVLHRAAAPSRAPVPRTGWRRPRPDRAPAESIDQPVGGDVVHHGHQYVLVIGDAEKRCPQGDLGGQVKRVARRRPRRPRSAGLPASRRRRRSASRIRPRRRGSPPAAGFPSTAGNSVRRLSWRPTTSASAAPSASASSRPLSRSATAML